MRLVLEVANAGSNRDKEIVLLSCDGMPNIANGCGAGKYKQVGDHVNRGFEQRADTHKSVAKTANANF